jgi:hypothetical protein
MLALTKILAGGAFVAALASAAPASAQYYPGYGYGNGGNVIGQVLNQVLGGGVGYGNYGGYGGYGAGTQQAAVSQCAAAVQQRLGGGYGAGYGGYGNNGYNGGGRVLGISRVEPRSGGGVTVRGVASSGGNAGYGYGYNGGYDGQAQADLTFKCKADYRGFVTSVSFDRVNGSSSYNNSPYDYSQYGYRRY